jgi:hypothetical protein
MEREAGRPAIRIQWCDASKWFAGGRFWCGRARGRCAPEERFNTALAAISTKDVAAQRIAQAFGKWRGGLRKSCRRGDEMNRLDEQAEGRIGYVGNLQQN